jgi:hypothetical protein
MALASLLTGDEKLRPRHTQWAPPTAGMQLCHKPEKQQEEANNGYKTQDHNAQGLVV